MKFLIFSDMHFNNWPQFSKILDSGINSRLANQINVTKQIIKYCIKHNIKTVFHLGDMVDSKRSIHTDTLHFIFKVLPLFKKNGIKLYHINGNHDYYEESGRIYSSKILSRIAKVIAKYKKIVIGDIAFHCLPYISSIDKIRSVMSNIEIDKHKINILLSHMGLQEAKVGPEELVIHEGLSVNDIENRFDYIFLGHYHKHQIINNNVYYVGSPLMHNFGERNDTKGFIVVDQDSKKFKIDFIETKAPKFIEKHIDKIDEIADIKAKHSNDFVKIIADNKINLNTIDIDDNIVIENNYTNEDDIENRLDIDSGTSINEIINKFIDKIDIEFLNKDKLKKIGKEIING